MVFFLEIPTYCTDDQVKLYQNFVRCSCIAADIRYLITQFVLVNHWFLAIIDIWKLKIYLFDSLSFKNQLKKIHNSCINICNLFYIFRNQVPESISKFKLFVLEHPFKQKDSTSCGLFICKFANFFITKDANILEASLEEIVSHINNILSSQKRKKNAARKINININYEPILVTDHNFNFVDYLNIF